MNQFNFKKWSVFSLVIDHELFYDYKVSCEEHYDPLVSAMTEAEVDRNIVIPKIFKYEPNIFNLVPIDLRD